MKEVKEKLQIPKNINNGRCLMDCLTKKIILICNMILSCLKLEIINYLYK